MESIDAFIDRLPKVELHLHLVGSASVPTVLELARRHPGSPVPRSAAELAAFYEFRDFPHFAMVYGAVSSLVREPADVAEVVLGPAAARLRVGRPAAYGGSRRPGRGTPRSSGPRSSPTCSPRTWPSRTPRPTRCGPRPGCWPSARRCSRSGPEPGCCPRRGPGAGSALLRLVAAGALIAAAGLVLPYVARDDGGHPAE